MKRKKTHERALKIVASAILMGVAVIIATAVLRDNMIFYFTPTETLAKHPIGIFKLGGMVKEGSLIKDGKNISFILTDYETEIPVEYTGLTPMLFKEGQGTVATGKFDGKVFIASEILAKHDEKYMPREVAESLQKKKATGANDGTRTRGL